MVERFNKITCEFSTCMVKWRIENIFYHFFMQLLWGSVDTHPRRGNK